RRTASRIDRGREPPMKNKPAAEMTASAKKSDARPPRAKDAASKLDAAAIRAKEKEFLWPSLSHYYQEHVTLESGAGLRVRDVAGREYLDFFGGILTISVGHCNERVNTALKAQIDRLGHVSTLYPSLPMIELAETLARVTPGRLRKTYFTASGTEADETAV